MVYAERSQKSFKVNRKFRKKKTKTTTQDSGCLKNEHFFFIIRLRLARRLGWHDGSGRVARRLGSGGTAARDGWHGGSGRVARLVGTGGAAARVAQLLGTGGTTARNRRVSLRYVERFWLSITSRSSLPLLTRCLIPRRAGHTIFSKILFFSSGKNENSPKHSWN